MCGVGKPGAFDETPTNHLMCTGRSSAIAAWLIYARVACVRALVAGTIWARDSVGDAWRVGRRSVVGLTANYAYSSGGELGNNLKEFCTFGRGAEGVQ